MAVTYEKTFEIEIINELSASVYNRVLNYVLNHELNKNDSQLLEVNLLNQLKLAKRVNLFDYSLEELQAVHEYWRSMNRYSKQVLNKEKVAMVAGQIGQLTPMDEETADLFKQLAKKMMKGIE